MTLEEEGVNRTFNAETRSLIHTTLNTTLRMSHADLCLSYVKALEDVAVAAQKYLANTTATNAVGLDAALDAVDRMQV